MHTEHKPFNGHTELPWKASIDDEGHVIEMGTAIAENPYEPQHRIEYRHGCYRGDQFNEADANVDFIIHATSTYYSREAELGSLRESVQKLQAFKDYVHQRLDEAGIEKDPPGEHSEAGCRVGQRLDIALGPNELLRESLKKCVGALNAGVFPNTLSADEVALLAMNNAGSQKSIDTAREIANDYRAAQDAMRAALDLVKERHPNL